MGGLSDKSIHRLIVSALVGGSKEMSAVRGGGQNRIATKPFLWPNFGKMREEKNHVLPLRISASNFLCLHMDALWEEDGGFSKNTFFANARSRWIEGRKQTFYQTLLKNWERRKEIFWKLKICEGWNYSPIFGGTLFASLNSLSLGARTALPPILFSFPLLGHRT